MSVNKSVKVLLLRGKKEKKWRINQIPNLRRTSIIMQLMKPNVKDQHQNEVHLCNLYLRNNQHSR